MSELEQAGVARLNTLSTSDAERELLTACASTAWARQVAAARPFRDLAHLLEVSDAVWATVGEAGVREAFAGHPRLGEKKAERAQSERERRWSTDEQAGVTADDAATAARERLARANVAYEQRFGHIFLLCATGKSLEDILAAIERRLANDPPTELVEAAEEQRKITRLRLEKMVRT